MSEPGKRFRTVTRLRAARTRHHPSSLSRSNTGSGAQPGGDGLEASWNVMTHAQKPDFVFRRNGRVHLNRRGRQFSRMLTAEVCASAVVMVVMLDTPCSEVVWRVLATHLIRQFPLHFPSRASPCVIAFQLESNGLKQPGLEDDRPPSFSVQVNLLEPKFYI